MIFDNNNHLALLLRPLVALNARGARICIASKLLLGWQNRFCAASNSGHRD
jgi:hypothetical protein